VSTELSVVVPVYNEEESVPILCESLHQTLSGMGRSYEIVLVDDGSADGSWDTLKKLAAAEPRLRALRLAQQSGQSAALWAGIKAARGAVIITLAPTAGSRPNLYITNGMVTPASAASSRLRVIAAIITMPSAKLL